MKYVLSYVDFLFFHKACYCFFASNLKEGTSKPDERLVQRQREMVQIEDGRDWPKTKNSSIILCCLDYYC